MWHILSDGQTVSSQTVSYPSTISISFSIPKIKGAGITSTEDISTVRTTID
ncbi:MAG: hypothetical protein HVN35_10860 [Methanobacteriaceae archaeon]|nr:hypothetical protein [Methanobacteriaceae archaeon]